MPRFADFADDIFGFAARSHGGRRIILLLKTVPVLELDRGDRLSRPVLEGFSERINLNLKRSTLKINSRNRCNFHPHNAPSPQPAHLPAPTDILCRNRWFLSTEPPLRRRHNAPRAHAGSLSSKLPSHTFGFVLPEQLRRANSD